MIIQNLATQQSDFRVSDNKFLLAGLGNIGDKYENTRHNAGFMFIDEVLRFENIDQPRLNKDFHGDFQRFGKDNFKFFIIKPSTYMNESGMAVRAVAKYYDLLSKNLVLIHDDLDIEFGKYKIQFGKGPKIHNGIGSVESALGTNEFWRIRIGTEGRTPEMRLKFESRDYVLSRFTKSEKELLHDMFKEIWEELLHKLNTEN